MNGLDIAIGFFLIIALIKGYSNGFLKELASLIAIIAGAYGGVYFSGYAQRLIAQFSNFSEESLVVLSFAATFIVIVIVVHALAGLLTKVADFAMLGLFNKLLGALFGMIKRALIISIVLMLLNAYTWHIPLINQENKESSLLYKPISAMGDFLLPVLIKEIEGHFIPQESEI